MSEPAMPSVPRSQRPEWVPVVAAANIVGRHPRSVYRWIASGRLKSRLSVDGIKEVRLSAVIAVEAQVRRGRPRGSVSW